MSLTLIKKRQAVWWTRKVAKNLNIIDAKL